MWHLTPGFLFAAIFIPCCPSKYSVPPVPPSPQKNKNNIKQNIFLKLKKKTSWNLFSVRQVPEDDRGKCSTQHNITLYAYSPATIFCIQIIMIKMDPFFPTTIVPYPHQLCVSTSTKAGLTSKVCDTGNHEGHHHGSLIMKYFLLKTLCVKSIEPLTK